MPHKILAIKFGKRWNFGQTNLPALNALPDKKRNNLAELSNDGEWSHTNQTEKSDACCVEVCPVNSRPSAKLNSTMRELGPTTACDRQCHWVRIAFRFPTKRFFPAPR